MEEEVGFGLARSRLTAIPRFCLNVTKSYSNKNAPASARSRNPRMYTNTYFDNKEQKD